MFAVNVRKYAEYCLKYRIDPDHEELLFKRDSKAQDQECS